VAAAISLFGFQSGAALGIGDIVKVVEECPRSQSPSNAIGSRPMSSGRQMSVVLYHPDAFLPAEWPFTFRQHETESNPM
jgi:hypothetical protein